jgi:hypothetical protein
MGPISSTETLVLNQPMLRNNPEDGRITDLTVSYENTINIMSDVKIILRLCWLHCRKREYAESLWRC